MRKHASTINPFVTKRLWMQEDLLLFPPGGAWRHPSLGLGSLKPVLVDFQRPDL
jgi:hypothetical protein